MNLRNNEYGVKNCNLSIKVDSDSRIVKGYFAAFGNIDSDSDMIIKGAFSRSLNNNGVDSSANRKIAHLLYHDVKRPVGNLTVLKEDDAGLYFESKLGTHTDGEDAFKMYNEDIIREHSIGFNYIGDKMELIKGEDGAKDYFLIKEVKLWEGSAVVFGANSLTPNLTNAKSQKDLDNLSDEIDQRFEVFLKALKDNTYQEKYNNMFECELRQIKTLAKSLKTFDSSSDTLKDDSNGEEQKSKQLQILKSLKNGF